MALRISLLRCCCSLGFLLLAGSRTTAEVGLGFIHPLQACDPKVVNACEAAPSDGKEHVYTFIVNGLDPLQLANLNGMTGYLRRLGFPQTHYEPLLSYRATKRHIREIRQSDPDAKIVLVGYSAGALMVRRLANDLQRENIAVDRLVYLGGDFIPNTQGSRPSNVATVVNIRGHGSIFSGRDLFFNGADLDHASNLRLDSRHFLLPSREQTMDTLASELASLAKDSHLAIAARQHEETQTIAGRQREESSTTGLPNTDLPNMGLPTAGLPNTGLPRNRIEEKSPLEVYPTSHSRPGTAPAPKP